MNLNSSTKKKSIALLPAKLKAPISSTNPLRVKLTLQNQRLENKILLKEMEEMKLAIKNYSVSIQEDIHTDFRELFHNIFNVTMYLLS